MKKIRLNMNLLLIGSIFLLDLLLLFKDGSYLNSLLIDYDDTFVINEVNIDDDYEEVLDTNNDVTVNNVDNNSVLVSKSNVANLNSWRFPVDGEYVITTYYGYGHKAIDIYQGYGSSILAANNGVVDVVRAGCVVGDLGCNGRGGNYVIINHNNGNYYTVYMHLKDIYVGVGDVVSSGDVIGSMGNTGNVIPVPTSSNPYGGTHLHFCVYIGHPDRGGYAINPFDLY